MKMPWAVSGRRYAVEPDSFTGPIVVSNIRLKSRASVRSHSDVSPGCLEGLRPHCELVEVIGPEALLARPAVDQRVGESRQVPDASHTRGCCRIAESSRRCRRVPEHRPPPLALDVALQQHA